MKNNYLREWCLQERRYERAKRNAEKHNELARKHVRLTEAWVNIMRDAADKQERISRKDMIEAAQMTEPDF
jgi:hypothetical protein